MNKIWFVIVPFFYACTSTSSKSNRIIIPENYVRLDDSSLRLVDSIYIYKGEEYSGHLIQGNVQANKLDYSYHSGIQEGLQKGWHSNGNLSFEYECKGGLREGEYREYYPNGNLQILKKYEHGVVVQNKIKDIDGKTIANYTYKDGRLYGLLGSSSCISVIEDYEK